MLATCAPLKHKFKFNSENVFICREDAFKKSIKQKLDSLPDVYAQNTVTDIYNRLLPLTGVKEKIKEQHINAIREAANGDVCPRSGGKLVLRTAKKERTQETSSMVVPIILHASLLGILSKIFKETSAPLGE